MVIPIRSSIPKDKATATITSLPPKEVGFPNPSSVSGVSSSSEVTSPSGVPNASGLPGATGPVAAAGAPAPSSPSSPVGTNVAVIPGQAQSEVTLTPAGWQNKNYILEHPLTLDR